MQIPDKTSETYVEMIRDIGTISKQLSDLIGLQYLPNTCLSDFEQAIMLAFKHVFPGIEVKGCYFHFKHVHQGWLNRNGWKKIYRSNNDFRIWVNMFGALALMPINKIDECLSIIKARSIQFTTLEKNINDFMVYFEKTWLNGVEWMRPQVWNYFDYIGHRTNNDLESFNKQANAALREKNQAYLRL